MWHSTIWKLHNQISEETPPKFGLTLMMKWIDWCPQISTKPCDVASYKTVIFILYCYRIEKVKLLIIIGMRSENLASIIFSIYFSCNNFVVMQDVSVPYKTGKNVRQCLATMKWRKQTKHQMKAEHTVKSQKQWKARAKKIFLTSIKRYNSRSI
jgi:hypothetical protein